MEGLEICPSSVKITSVRNMSRNTSNEWNKVNYIEEPKDQNFYLNTWRGKLKTWDCWTRERNNSTHKGWQGMENVHVINSLRLWMQWASQGCGCNE